MFDLNYQEVKSSCGVTHENNFFIYGGESNKRQVLQLVDCALTLFGTIPFDHGFGPCGSSNGLIVLCFADYDAKQCRKSLKPLGEWSEMTPSTFDHGSTQIATSPGLVNLVAIEIDFSVLDSFLAVGSRWSNKAELYDFGIDDWIPVQDYPFHSGSGWFYAYDMVYIPATSAYYVIGGSDYLQYLATIGMFKNGAWSKAGQLNTARPVSFLFVSVLLIQFSVSSS